MSTIDIVVPCYNEEEGLAHFVEVTNSVIDTIPQHKFSGCVEHAIAHIEECVLNDIPEEQQRWYAVKLFERDGKVYETLNISGANKAHIETDIAATEKEMDDDSESIITNERYIYIGTIIRECLKKKNKGGLTVTAQLSDHPATGAGHQLLMVLVP